MAYLSRNCIIIIMKIERGRKLFQGRGTTNFVGQIATLSPLKKTSSSYIRLVKPIRVNQFCNAI